MSFRHRVIIAKNSRIFYTFHIFFYIYTKLIAFDEKLGCFT